MAVTAAAPAPRTHLSHARRCAPAALLAGLLVAGPALADRPLWELGAGAGGLRLPHYRGSDQSHNWLLPVPFFVYHGPVLRADRDGSRAVLLDSERLDFDVGLSASPPTRSNRNRARAGMPDLAPTLEFGPQMNWRVARGQGWQVDLRVPLRAVISLQSRPRDMGWTLEPVLNADLELGGFNLGLQAGPLWADRRQHQKLYGVAPVYATASRPAYGAAGGYAGWQATAGLSRRIGRLWLGAYVRSDSLAGAAFEDSPLVKSRHNTAFGLAMAWVFATSEARVPDAP